jgi:hypothetical protein
MLAYEDTFSTIPIVPIQSKHASEQLPLMTRNEEDSEFQIES